MGEKLVTPPAVKKFEIGGENPVKFKFVPHSDLTGRTCFATDQTLFRSGCYNFRANGFSPRSSEAIVFLGAPVNTPASLTATV